MLHGKKISFKGNEGNFIKDQSRSIQIRYIWSKNDYRRSYWVMANCGLFDVFL